MSWDRTTPPGSLTAPRGFRENVAILTAAFESVPTALKVLKVGEEFGEAIQAYIGTGGWNPRKGVYSTPDEVAKELADIVVTALIALSDFSVEPVQTVTLRMAEVTERHLREVAS